MRSSDSSARECARLLDVTEKKISSQKKTPRHRALQDLQSSQECTRKELRLDPRPSKCRPHAQEDFGGRYYMNLTALKPKKGQGSAAEESDKSLAILVNLLKGPLEREAPGLDVIREERRQQGFNRVVRLGKGRKAARPAPGVEKQLDFRRKGPAQGAQRKISFAQKRLVDKKTQLIAMPFSKGAGHANLVLDKKCLLHHLKRKRGAREAQGTGRGASKPRAERKASAKKQANSGPGKRARKQSKEARALKAAKLPRKSGRKEARPKGKAALPSEKALGAPRKEQSAGKGGPKSRRALSKKTWADQATQGEVRGEGARQDAGERAPVRRRALPEVEDFVPEPEEGPAAAERSLTRFSRANWGSCAKRKRPTRCSRTSRTGP